MGLAGPPLTAMTIDRASALSPTALAKRTSPLTDSADRPAGTFRARGEKACATPLAAALPDKVAVSSVCAVVAATTIPPLTRCAVAVSV